jgi:acetylxylan esterase
MWQNKVNYGGSTVMDLYVPDKVDASPGVVVSLHYCSGTSSNAHGWFQQYADMYGFIIIAPSAGGNCFDAGLGRSGERQAIANMVAYVIDKNKADKTRVFAAGASSGACMTQALLASYPDVFAGGSVLAGVPAGAWTSGNSYGWTTPDSRTAAEWGDLVRKAGPMGFAGPWPKIQLWHGTADTTLNYMPNFPAEVKEWTNVLGVSDASSMKSSFKGSQDTWDRTSYTNASSAVVLETNVAMGAPHDLSGRGLWADVVRFFGLDQDGPPTMGGSGGMGGAGGTGSGMAGGGMGGTTPVGTGGTGGSTIPSGGGMTTTPQAGTGGIGTVGPAVGGTQASSGGQPATSGGTGSSIGGIGPVSSNNDAGTSDAGCGCRTTSGGSGFGAAALSAFGLGLWLSRRRRAR